MKLAAAAVAGTVALVLAGSSLGATPKFTKWIVKAQGFSIILPVSWDPVPRTVKAVQQTIAALNAQKKTTVAHAFAYYLTPAGKQELSAYVFEAFDTTPSNDDPLAPQVAVQVTKPKTPYKASALKAAVDVFGASIASNKGAKLANPARISLPTGTWETFKATVPAGQVTRGIEMYLTIHEGKLYVFSFQIDAQYLAQAKLFRSIAENLRWA